MASSCVYVAGDGIRGYATPTDRLSGEHMTTFDDRERGFEKKFELDQELQFKVKARRNKLLGLWAAGAWPRVAN